MIISASRRTDIPAFYSRWFLNRLEAGECVTRNPFNPKQQRRISLKPEDVTAFVFWSKNPAPFRKVLDRLDRRGFRYYFQFTLNDYPSILEPGIPPLKERIEEFRYLADRLGSERVVWRYDPVLISDHTDPEYHRRAFNSLCSALQGRTKRVMTSFADWYRKTERNLSRLEKEGAFLFDRNGEETFGRELLRFMADSAGEHGITLYTCSSSADLSDIGVQKGRCVDPEILRSVWGVEYSVRKDPGQRKECLCAVSRDIGFTNSCPAGCVYCYSNTSPEAGKRGAERHNSNDESLLRTGAK